MSPRYSTSSKIGAVIQGARRPINIADMSWWPPNSEREWDSWLIRGTTEIVDRVCCQCMIWQDGLLIGSKIGCFERVHICDTCSRRSKHLTYYMIAFVSLREPERRQQRGIQPISEAKHQDTYRITWQTTVRSTRGESKRISMDMLCLNDGLLGCFDK